MSNERVLWQGTDARVVSGKSETPGDTTDHKKRPDDVMETSAQSTTKGGKGKEKERPAGPSTSTARRARTSDTQTAFGKMTDPDDGEDSDYSDTQTSFGKTTQPNDGEDSDTDSDSESEDVSASDGEFGSWIAWFCGLSGNEYFCEVDQEYIQDAFNLCDLRSQIPYYDYALDVILDVESPNDDILTEDQHDMVETAAETLYGLIHARYVLTVKGMNAMLEKFKGFHFGTCPRVYCSGQSCIPMGQSDILRTSGVKIYCPRCEDIYSPRPKCQGIIDGAYFGTTFPHLFLMTYPHIKPPKPTLGYIPRIFGFKLRRGAG